MLQVSVGRGKQFPIPVKCFSLPAESCARAIFCASSTSWHLSTTSRVILPLVSVRRRFESRLFAPAMQATQCVNPSNSAPCCIPRWVQSPVGLDNSLAHPWFRGPTPPFPAIVTAYSPTASSTPIPRAGHRAANDRRILGTPGAQARAMQPCQAPSHWLASRFRLKPTRMELSTRNIEVHPLMMDDRGVAESRLLIYNRETICPRADKLTMISGSGAP